MRVIGVDFGDVRTGIAVSDESMFIASGVGTVTAKGLSALADRIGEYCRMYGASKIVMGRPLNMDDTAGPRAEKADRFAAILRERTGLEVILTDERLTTVEAHEFLDMTDTRGRKRKKVIDTLSAEIILQNWLDGERKKRSENDNRPI